MRNFLAAFLALLSASYCTHAVASFETSDASPADGRKFCIQQEKCARLRGEITDHDAFSLDQWIQSLPKKGPSPTLEVDSYGGNLKAAIHIGRTLRQYKAMIRLWLPGKCLSACVFILAGAPNRIALGQIGVHRPYSNRTGQVDIGVLQREYTELSQLAKEYLREMNISDELFELMVRTPAEQIRVLSPQEVALFGLNQNDPVYQEWVDSIGAKQYGTSKQEYLRRKVLSNQLCVPILEKTKNYEKWNGCEQRVMTTGK